MAKGRSELLESIADTIADYRAGEIAAPTAEHVERWVEQFQPAVQEPILAELDHVLSKSYVTKDDVQEFLGTVVSSSKFTGSDPGAFWRSANLLHIQEAGHSQRDMLELLAVPLKEKVGLDIGECGSADGAFIYLDDFIFSGNRVGHDLVHWIREDAPEVAQIRVVVIAYHRGGQWYAKQQVEKAIQESEKTIEVTWWRKWEIESRKSHSNVADVLRPVSIPDDTATQAYVEQLRYEPALRKGEQLGARKYFASARGRHLMEQEFLKAGVRIRSMCPYLNDYQRPLGNMVLDSLGFGAVVVTYRNCPNNCPLVFWAGDPWYPLFPRKTN